MIKSIVFNVLVFALACGLIYKAKTTPEYKVGLGVTAALLYLINVRCVVEILLEWNERDKAKKRQEANIVTGYCPDYWTKGFNDKNQVVCKPNFYFKENSGSTKYILGSQDLNLNEFNEMKNNVKCDLVKTRNLPWMDMKRKCAGYSL